MAERFPGIDWWCDRCLEYCPEIPDEFAFGDQKYLDYFSDQFTGIYVYDDFGMGIAPWNVDDYLYAGGKQITSKKDKQTGDLIFYHFHSLSLIGNSMDINVYKRPGKKDTKLIDYLYKPYIDELKRCCDLICKKSSLPNFHKTNRILELFNYLFEENNLLIAFGKFFRLVLYRKNDIFSL